MFLNTGNRCCEYIFKSLSFLIESRKVPLIVLFHCAFFMPPFYLLVVCFDMLLNLLYSPVVMACRC